MQVSGFVEKLNTRIKAINPKLRLSAAVFSDIADANVDYAQDWPEWLHKGIIAIYPRPTPRSITAIRSNWKE
jgi:uncharacterized lipoprotein YddW (UPF0748 family)